MTIIPFPKQPIERPHQDMQLNELVDLCQLYRSEMIKLLRELQQARDICETVGDRVEMLQTNLLMTVRRL